MFAAPSHRYFDCFSYIVRAYDAAYEVQPERLQVHSVELHINRCGRETTPTDSAFRTIASNFRFCVATEGANVVKLTTTSAQHRDASSRVRDRDSIHSDIASVKLQPRCEGAVAPFSDLPAAFKPCPLVDGSCVPTETTPPEHASAWTLSLDVEVSSDGPGRI